VTNETEDTAPLIGKRSNGWGISPANFGVPGADYLTRGMNAVLGLTANTIIEAIYCLATTDGHGRLPDLETCT
jgi:hypothetical protein